MGPPPASTSGKTLTQSITEVLKNTTTSTKSGIQTGMPTTPSTHNSSRGPSPSPKTRYTLTEIKQKDEAKPNKYLNTLKQSTKYLKIQKRPQ